MKTFLKIFVFLLIILYNNLYGVNLLFSQESGKTFIKNYLPKEYKGHIQNWDIVQDKRGVLYFANVDGILEYDGSSFKLITLPQNKMARTLAVDNEGIVYYGSEDDFGFLYPGANGKLEAKSLAHLLNENDKNFGYVWQTLNVDGTIYFRASRKLFSYRDEKITSWTFIHNTSWLFSHNEKLFLHEKNSGIKVLKEGVFIPAKNNIPSCYFALPYQNGKVVLGSNSNRLEFFDTDSLDVTRRFFSEIDIDLLDTRLYSACVIDSSTYALGTYNVGAFIINKAGKLIQKFNKENGLQNQCVYGIMTDQAGTLWFALDNGLTNAQISSPISYWDKTNGLNEPVEVILRYQGRLYIGTHGGVYYLENNDLKRINNYNGQCWSLLDFKEPNDTSKHHLLIGTTNGVFEVRDNQLYKKICSPMVAFKLLQSKKEPRRVFIAKHNGISSIFFNGESWLYEGDYEGVKSEIRSIAENESGDLWLGSFRNGIIKLSYNDSITKPKVKFYKMEAGLPSLKNILIYKYNNRLIFATEGGLYKYDKNHDKFVPDSSLGQQFCNGSRDVFSFSQKNNGNVWLSGVNNTKGEIGVATMLSNNSYEWYSIPFKVIPEMMVLSLYVEKNGTAWIGGSEGLFKYDPKKDAKKQNTFKTLIREVSVADSIIFYGTFAANQGGIKKNIPYQPENLIPELPFKNRSMRFSFSAPDYSREESNVFSYKLVGFDKKWSEWTNLNFKEYTNLRSGVYEFKVKSKNVFGVEGEEANYRFVILSPWYKMWWAYIVYGFFVVLFVWLLIKLNTYRLQKENERLEQIVRIRTEEIVAQNEEINGQKEELNAYKNYLEELVEKRTDELFLAKEKAEESDKLKTAFLENISHEIRTPMNAILGYTDLLAMKDDQYEEELKIITSNFNQLLGTIDNIISLSKLHTKQLEIVRSIVKVEQLFIELQTYINREIHKKDSQVAFNYLVKQDGLSIIGDFSALYFMFKHLLDNALKYTEEGEILILAQRNSKNSVEIVVKDTGIGIIQEELPYVFDLFRKLKNKEKTFRGTGAGLAIVKSIVELHNAEIIVSSEQGKETMFIITFSDSNLS